MKALSQLPIESQKMEIVGRLATSVIHDLNNFLTLVQLNAALLEQGGVTDEEVREVAGKIGQACTRSSELTRKVLDLARRRARVDKPFDVGALVVNHSGLLKTFFTNRAELVVERHAEDLWVRGDVGDFEQALLNLILNAVDSLVGRGQVRVECFARAEALGEPAAKSEGWVEVSVADTGCGIPEQDWERIFEPLYTTKPDGLGTGMGLFTVRRVVVERLQGSIVVESEVGKGSRFRMFVPRTWVPGRGPGVARPREGGIAGNHLVLFVEDDAGIRELTRSILENAGMRVVDASNAEAGLVLWQRHREEVTLLLTDLVLPGAMNGRDLAVRVLADRPELPVIYASGFLDVGKDNPYLTPQNFLRKPFHPDALKRRVAEVLGGAGD